MKRKKILLIFAFLLVFFIPFSVFAKEISRLECVYGSTESLKPKETLTVVIECEKLNGSSKGECTDSYKINGKNMAASTTIKQGEFELEFEKKDCPKKINIEHSIHSTLYDGKYDNVGMTEKEEVQETAVYVIMQDNFVLVNIGFILEKESYSVGTNKVSCGSGEGMVDGIPKKIPELTSLAITIIQIAVPVILILMGSIDLFKGITAGKEDEIKKGQQTFIKRLVMGGIIFFVVIIVKFIISIVSDTNVSNIVSCIDCFIDNSCTENSN